MPKPVGLLTSVLFSVALPAMALAASPKSVLSACINASSGIHGTYSILTGVDASGQYARISSGENVSSSTAKAINECADANGGNTGLASANASAEIVNARSRTIVRSVRAPNGYRGSTCGRNPSILYRGDLYCQWARR